MAGQSNIKVDAGSGSPVDFSVTNSAANFRQAVTIGDPLVDANYVTVAGGAANVTGSVVITNSPTLGAASNVIGSVSVVGTVPVSGTVTTTPSGVQNVTGTITAVSSGTITAISGAETSTIWSGNTALTPTFTAIVFSAVGNTSIIATVTSKRIRVIAMSFIVGTATNVFFQDSNGVALWANASNPGNFAANSGIVLPYCPQGYFQTGAGNGLTANISAASVVAGAITYVTI